MTILFDLDGTLIDSTDAILQSFEHAFTQHNHTPPAQKQILALIGHPLDFMFAHLGVNSGAVNSFVTSYKQHYKMINRQMTTLLPRAKEAVELADSFATLAVVTTKTGIYSVDLLKHLGIMHHFKFVIGREDVVNPKPDPEPILKALHRLECDPAHSWMIGDTTMDINCAKKANIKSVAVKCGYGDHNELHRCSEFVQKDSYDAVQFIRRFETMTKG